MDEIKILEKEFLETRKSLKEKIDLLRLHLKTIYPDRLGKILSKITNLCIELRIKYSDVKINFRGKEYSIDNIWMNLYEWKITFTVKSEDKVYKVCIPCGNSNLPFYDRTNITLFDAYIFNATTLKEFIIAWIKAFIEHLKGIDKEMENKLKEEGIVSEIIKETLKEV